MPTAARPASSRDQIGASGTGEVGVTADPDGTCAACRETERAQHAHTVGVDQEPRSQSMPSLLSLDELRREAMVMEGCRRGESGYPSADDQDRLDLCHGSLQSQRTGSTVCRGSRSLAGSGLLSWIGRNSDWDQSEIVR